MKFENRKQRNALLDIAGTLHIKLLSLFFGGGGPLLPTHHLQNYSLTEDTQAKPGSS